MYNTGRWGVSNEFFDAKIFVCRPVPPPHLILLDLNLPKKSILKVLGEINSAPKLKMIPVVIMTTSAADEEILKSYALLARCYIAKPADFSQVAKLVRWIEDWWWVVVTVPK